MDEQDKIDLKGAVFELNHVLIKLLEKYGDKIQIRPGINYNTNEGTAAVYVEVTQGVEKF